MAGKKLRLMDFKVGMYVCDLKGDDKKGTIEYIWRIESIQENRVSFHLIIKKGEKLRKKEKHADIYGHLISLKEVPEDILRKYGLRVKSKPVSINIHEVI